MKKRYLPYFVFLIGLFLLTVLAFLGLSIWITRIIFGLTIVTITLTTPAPIPLFTGVFSIPADLITISRSAGNPNFNSLDLLVWAMFILIPIFSDNVVFKEIGEGPDSKPEKDPEEDSTTTTSTEAENVEYHPEVKNQSLDPEVEVQKLIKKQFKSIQEILDSDNLIYFHVTDGEAQPGYVINNLGNIDQQLNISDDQARGVGWVLRHEEELKQEGKQLDWRNLQYHTQPVAVGSVHMKPVIHGTTFLGILVVEWKEKEREFSGKLDEICEEVSSLMVIDRSIRRMQKKEREGELFRQLSDLKFDSSQPVDVLQQRVKDLVQELIPADKVEYLNADVSQIDENVVKQRQLFHQRCRNWIIKQEEILRINDIGQFTINGKPMSQVAPPNVQSFLGGPLLENGKVYGLICLTHDSKSFFSSEDEKILSMLLDWASGLIKNALEVTSLKQQRSELNEWLENINSMDSLEGISDLKKDILNLIQEKMDASASGIYQRSEQQFILESKTENFPLPEKLSGETSLLKTVEKSDNQILLEFPNPSRFNEFRVNTQDNMYVLTGDVDKEFPGHFACFFKPDELESYLKDELEQIWPIVSDKIKLARQIEKLEMKKKTDEWSGMPRFGSWKSRLGQMATRENSETIKIWVLRIPGFDTVAKNRGRRRAKKWVKSLCNQIKGDLSSSKVTRSYGSVFYGYDGSTTKVESRLEQLCNEIEDWSFPTGSWPGDPRASIKTFKKPFPEAQAMIEAVRKEVLINSQNVENSNRQTSEEV